MKQLEAMKQWLAALEHSNPSEPMWKTPHKEAKETLRQAIEQAQKQEPVAFIDNRIHGFPDCFVNQSEPPHTSPVYTSPPQRQPLTNEEIDAATQYWAGAVTVPLERLILCREYARAIEAAHGITGEQK